MELFTAKPMTTGRVPAESERGGSENVVDSDPYRAAQTYALEEVARERAACRSWKRVACGAIALSAFLAVDHLALIGKLRGPAQSLVLDRDEHGYRFLGVAQDTNAPSDVALQAGVRTWIEDARSIPGIDTTLADEQKNTVYAMTDAHAPIKATLDSYYGNSEQRKLGKYEVRAVSGVDVTPMPTSAGAATRTYIVHWTERTQTSAGVSTQTYSRQVTIAANAPVPGDPAVATLNPNGVYVEQVATDSPLR